MLSAGDLLWVPATYSLQARYLASHPHELGIFGTAAVLGLNAFGYWMFRTANGDKDKFRNGRNPKSEPRAVTDAELARPRVDGDQARHASHHLWYVHPPHVTDVPGLWGMSRHPNYLGDWLMSIAWCLPSGIYAPLTFFYAVYFAILLVHRQLRDDHACKLKCALSFDV